MLAFFRKEGDDETAKEPIPMFLSKDSRIHIRSLAKLFGLTEIGIKLQGVVVPIMEDGFSAVTFEELRNALQLGGDPNPVFTIAGNSLSVSSGPIAVTFALSATEQWDGVARIERLEGRLEENSESILSPGLELPSDMPEIPERAWPVLTKEEGGDNFQVVYGVCNHHDCACKKLDEFGFFRGFKPRRKRINNSVFTSTKDSYYRSHAHYILQINHEQRKYCGQKGVDGPASLKAMVTFRNSTGKRPDVSYCADTITPTLVSQIVGVSEGKPPNVSEKWKKGCIQSWCFRVSALQEVFDVNHPPDNPIWRGSVVFGGSDVQFFCTYTGQNELKHKATAVYSLATIKDKQNVTWVILENGSVRKLLQEFVWGLGMEARARRNPVALLNRLSLKASGAPGPDHKDDTATFPGLGCSIDLLEVLYWKGDRSVVKGTASRGQEVIVKLAWDNMSARELEIEYSALSAISPCSAVPKIVAHGQLILMPSGLKVHLATALSPVGVDLRDAEIHGLQLCRLACRVLEALSRLQAVGRKHRDVKPQNIIEYKVDVDSDVDYMLVDFGAAVENDDIFFSDALWGPTDPDSPSSDYEGLVYTLVTVSGRTLPWEGLTQLAAHSSRVCCRGMCASSFGLEQETPELGLFAQSVMETAGSPLKPNFDFWINVLGKQACRAVGRSAKRSIIEDQGRDLVLRAPYQMQSLP